MNELSPEYISHLAHLARLELSLDEQIRFAAQLSLVVGYVEQLSKVSTRTTTLIDGVTGLRNILAEDQPRSLEDSSNIDSHILLMMAPLQENNFFIVRSVMDS